MTTLRELGEMLTEADETGRKIQTRLIGNGLWCDHTPVNHYVLGTKLNADKIRVALVLVKELSDLIDQNSRGGRLLKLLIEVLK